MLQAGYIAQNKEDVISALSKKNFDNNGLIDEVIRCDEDRKKIKFELDETLAGLNQISKEIGQLFSQGKKEQAEKFKTKSLQLKEKSKQFSEQLHSIERELLNKLVLIPNLPHESVPAGNSAADNVKVSENFNPPKLYQGAKPHWDLIEQFDLADLALGNKITGAGFPVYRKRGAKLQRALINFFLDNALEAGYEEVIPPYLVNEETAFGTGQLPDKEGQMYEMKQDPFFLIPTAEVPLTNIYRDVILNEQELPKKLVAYSPCFRREAGSYGKDVRGLNRVHQFDKVEIVQIQQPEGSYKALEEMVVYVEGLLRKLNLPYRIMKLCGGDMSFTSALTYDMEVYSAAQDMWLEVSSVSNFETFQSNRMKLRYRGKDNKTHLAHTLNGSALALPRIVAAILENNQMQEGILIPGALQPYTGFDLIS